MGTWLLLLGRPWSRCTYWPSRQPSRANYDQVVADDGLISAIEEAVARQPTNHELRSHLAGLLVDARRFSEALEHASVVLDARPDDLAALSAAARACRANGQVERADSFDRLLGALSGDSDQSDEVSTTAVPLPVSEPESEADDDVDRFLRDVLDEDDRKRVRLADVGGMEEAKRRLELSLLGPMRNPELRNAFKATLRGGLLMYGPPGCGKTFLAQALAGELGARFVHVGLHDVLDMWLGNSEKQLHEVFEQARRHGPTVLFFDEVDALGLKRSADPRSSTRGVSAQLLEELDGAGADNTDVFVVGATNAPWDVDPALRRPGRFDRTIFIGPPDERGRAAILAHHLRDRPAERLDLERLAKKTDGLSGADLKLLCESATELALEESIRSDRVVPITQAHLLIAQKQSRPTIGAWLDMARNVVAFANESGDYDELAEFVRRRR